MVFACSELSLTKEAFMFVFPDVKTDENIGFLFGFIEKPFPNNGTYKRIVQKEL